MTTRFDNAILKKIGTDLAEALKVISDTHGIQLVAEFEKSTTMQLNWKLKAMPKNATGEVIDQDKVQFTAQCGAFGLKASDYGAKFRFKNDWYQINGLNPGAWRFPISARRVRDGRQFRFPEAAVKSHLLPTASSIAKAS